MCVILFYFFNYSRVFFLLLIMHLYWLVINEPRKLHKTVCPIMLIVALLKNILICRLRDETSLFTRNEREKKIVISFLFCFKTFFLSFYLKFIQIWKISPYRDYVSNFLVILRSVEFTEFFANLNLAKH